MRKVMLASSLAISLMISGCGDRSTPPEQEKQELAVKASSLNTETNTIVTDEDFTTVTLFGDFGSKVFINDKDVGSFPESGSLEVTLSIKDAGTYTYNVYSISDAGVDSETIMIEVIKQEKSATLGSVSTKGEANALTVSKDGIIFVAEKNHGVEIISIGFNDRISSDLLSIIDSIDAENVILSDDESKLFVEDVEGKFHVLDISDLSNPIEINIIDQIEKSVSILSDDSTMRYRVSRCGLVGEDVSNPAQSEQQFLLEDKAIQDVVLVDDDTKLLVAHGREGLQLFDISDVTTPIMISSKNLNDDTSGLSLLKKDGILFVANGASGVQIFNLEILLHEMTH
ncbi:MAG TPA: hypothetical protein EYG95_02660 [Campylobacterales bacterium]|nr:hypothetical protein [Campylobacterales bacterium]